MTTLDEGLVQNAGLVGRHIEELYRLMRVQDDFIAALVDKQRRLYELMTRRFNEYFRSEDEARMAWELQNTARDTGRSVPALCPEPRSPSA